MKKIAINLFVNGVNYTSKYDNFDEQQQEQLEKLLKTAAEGKLSYMKFESDNKLLFFPSEILKQSILSLVYGS